MHRSADGRYILSILGFYCLVADPLAIRGDLIPNVFARSYKRREREKYECRPAQAPSSTALEKARRLWESGMIYYDAKEYQKARDDFQTAYEISRLPDFLINLAQVCAKLEQHADAIKYLETYVQECPGAPDVPIARQRIDDLRIAQAIKEGEQPPPRPVLKPPRPALALLGSGAVLLIIGAGLGGAAIVAGKRVGDVSNQNMVFSVDLQNTERRGRAMEGAAIGLDVIGGLALGVGGIWALSWLYEQKTGMSLTLSPRASGLALLGRF